MSSDTQSTSPLPSSPHKLTPLPVVGFGLYALSAGTGLIFAPQFLLNTFSPLTNLIERLTGLVRPPPLFPPTGPELMLWEIGRDGGAHRGEWNWTGDDCGWGFGGGDWAVLPPRGRDWR